MMKRWWIRLIVWLAKQHFPHLEQVGALLSHPLRSVVQDFMNRAEETGSLGQHKTEFVWAHVKAYYRQRKEPLPRERDVNLLIEFLVRGW